MRFHDCARIFSQIAGRTIAQTFELRIVLYQPFALFMLSDRSLFQAFCLQETDLERMIAGQ
jgi:hypothetical protein